MTWAAGLMTSALLYNPLTLARVDRAEEISSSCPNMDVVILVGTQQRADLDEEEGYCKRRLSQHVHYEFGWESRMASNKSAGISIFLKHGTLARGTITEIQVPSKSSGLRGRLASIRVRSRAIDLLLVGFTFLRVSMDRSSFPSTRQRWMR